MANFNKKTRAVYVQGKLGPFPKLKTPDVKFNCWVATIYPTKDSLEQIRELQAEGLKNVIKKDEDGYFVRFRCDTFKPRKDGTVWTFAQPVVVDMDNRPVDGDVVGQGSDVTLKLEVYEHPTPTGGKSIAARLVGVRVDNLIEFDPDRDMDDDTREIATGLNKVQPLF